MRDCWRILPPSQVHACQETPARAAVSIFIEPFDETLAVGCPLLWVGTRPMSFSTAAPDGETHVPGRRSGTAHSSEPTQARKGGVAPSWQSRLREGIVSASVSPVLASK